MMPDNKSSKPPAESDRPLGIDSDDPLVQMMLEDGIPVTRENYLRLAYPTGIPEWSAELEDELPEFLQIWPD